MMYALLAAALAGGAYFMFSKKENPEERAAKMATLADILFRMAIKDSKLSALTIAGGIQLAEKEFSLPKTAQGMRSGTSLPNDERWPGTNMSVAAYIAEYVKRNKPATPDSPRPAPAPAPAYNDESPIPPYEDPRKIRAQAVALDKQNRRIEAKILHVKADALNKIIRTAKTQQNIKSTAQGVASSVKSFLNFKG